MKRASNLIVFALLSLCSVIELTGGAKISRALQYERSIPYKSAIEDENLLDLYSPLDKIGGGVVIRELPRPEIQNSPQVGGAKISRALQFERSIPDDDNLLDLYSPLDKIGGGVVIRELPRQEIEEYRGPNSKNLSPFLGITGSGRANTITLNSSMPFEGFDRKEIDENNFLGRGNFPATKTREKRALNPVYGTGFNSFVVDELDNFVKRNLREMRARNTFVKRDFDEQDATGFNTFGNGRMRERRAMKRDFDEQDATGFNTFGNGRMRERRAMKRDFDEQDAAGFNTFGKRRMRERRAKKRDFDEQDATGFNTFGKKRMSERNAFVKKHFDEQDATGFNTFGKRKLSDMNVRNALEGKESEEMDATRFNTFGRFADNPSRLKASPSAFNPFNKRELD